MPVEPEVIPLSYAGLKKSLTRRQKVATCCGWISFLCVLIFVASQFFFDSLHGPHRVELFSDALSMGLGLGTALSAIRFARGPAKVLAFISMAIFLAFLTIILINTSWSHVLLFWRYIRHYSDLIW